MRDTIGKHLATFNLFREADNSIHVTIADAHGVAEELGGSGAPLRLCAMNALRAAVEVRQSARQDGMGEEVREALEPFARIEHHRDEPDHWPAYGKSAGQGWPTVGDFRRAAIVLARLSAQPAPIPAANEEVDQLLRPKTCELCHTVAPEYFASDCNRPECPYHQPPDADRPAAGDEERARLLLAAELEKEGFVSFARTARGEDGDGQSVIECCRRAIVRALQSTLQVEIEARRSGWRDAMAMARADGPPELVRRLQAMKPLVPSIYGPLIDQTCAALSSLKDQPDASDR